MKALLPLYIDRLRDGRIENIEQELDPKQLDIIDDEIDCVKPIATSIKAYLADDFLIICLSLSAELLLHCRICNEQFAFPLTLSHIDQEIPLDEIHDAVFDVASMIREILLVEVPAYPQCGGKVCCNRDSIKKYFSK